VALVVGVVLETWGGVSAGWTPGTEELLLPQAPSAKNTMENNPTFKKTDKFLETTLAFSLVNTELTIICLTSRPDC